MRPATKMRAAAFAAGIVLIGAAQPGVEQAAAGERANSFSGSCKLSGTAAWHPPLTNTAQATTQRARTTGTCSGTFTARNGAVHHLSDARVSWQTTLYAPNASCSAETDTGAGKIIFRYGTIRFTISETRAGPVSGFTLKGRRGGSAAGQANISPSVDPVAIEQACAGPGLTEVPFDIQATTTPSISG